MMSDLLRIELLHPIVIHFPIALLYNAGLVRFFIFVFHAQKWTGYLKAVYFWSLSAGIAGLFASYLSGEQAEHVVQRLICDPTVIEDHSDFGKLTILCSIVTLTFSTVVALMERRQVSSTKELSTERPSRIAGLKQAFMGVELFVLVATLGALAYASHLGASLVYQQGAGYHRTPDSKCNDSVESFDRPPEIITPIKSNENTSK